MTTRQRAAQVELPGRGGDGRDVVGQPRGDGRGDARPLPRTLPPAAGSPQARSSISSWSTAANPAGSHPSRFTVVARRGARVPRRRVPRGRPGLLQSDSGETTAAVRLVS
ncbi:hypothetical protein [Streptomyces youssoufiensis]